MTGDFQDFFSKPGTRHGGQARIGAAPALGAIGVTQRKRFAKRLRVIS